MNALSNFFYKKSSLLLALGFTVLSFGYLFIVMMSEAENFAVAGGEIFLGTSFGFSHQTVMQFLSVRNMDMLAAYKSFLSITDAVYPAIYGLQYIFWISFLYKPFLARAKWINLLGIVPCVLDWLENVQLISLTNQYIDIGFITESGVQLASVFSILKWISSIIIFVIIVTGIFFRLRHYLTNKKTNT